MITEPAAKAIKQRARLWTALFFLALTLTGLITSFDYGQNFDAVMEQYILKMNVLEYSYQILGPEHPMTKYLEWEGIDRILDYVERFHGQSAYYLAIPLLKLETHARDWFRPVWCMYTFLVFMVGVWSVYAFGREMGFGRLISGASALVMYLTPRFFAEGHYNNKDMAVLSLVLLTAWLGLRFLKKPCAWRGLLLSFAAAMAANTRIIGAFAWGLVGLCAVVQRFVKKDWSLRMGLTAFVTVVSFPAFFLLLTPAAWSDIPGHLDHILKNTTHYSIWSGNVLYQGILTKPSQTPLPWHYIPNLMLLTLPLYTLPLAAVGEAAMIRSLVREKSGFFKDERKIMLLAATALWLVPLVYAAAARPLAYNSWRHFYFAYAGIALMAGHGIASLQSLFSRRKSLRRLGAAALGLCLGISAVGMALNHPYQYGYYNLLAPKALENYYELDYWEVSTVSALKKLYAMKDELPYPTRISAPEHATTDSLGGKMILPYEVRTQLDVIKEGQAEYMLYNTTYSVVYNKPYPPEGYHELFRINSYGNTLCIMYEKDQ